MWNCGYLYVTFIMDDNIRNNVLRLDGVKVISSVINVVQAYKFVSTP